jgi:hypothetical protein
MKLRFILFILLISNSIIAQNYISVGANKYFLGCKLNKSEFLKVKESEDRKSRSIESLKSSFTLSKFLPEIGDQSYTGTCVSWATSYYTLSILYNIKNPTKLSFSPFFLYNNLKNNKDSSCLDGLNIVKALQFLKYKGGVPNNKYLSQCKINKDTSTKNWDIAINYRIKSFKSIGSDNRIQRIKKSLSLLKPIVIGINTPYGFASSLNGDTWDGIVDDMRGGHALSLIGYDDNKEGGSFEIINSWGKGWGDNGKIWVKYSDFDKIVEEVYEVSGYDNRELERYSKKNTFVGSIKVFDKNGKALEELNTFEDVNNNLSDTSDFINDTSSVLIDTNTNVVDTSINPFDNSFDIGNLMLDNDFETIDELKPEFLEYNFKYKLFENVDDFKFKISNYDSAYIYLFSYDNLYSTITPITKDNNKEIFLFKKKSDIILPETTYLNFKKDFNTLKKYVILISKGILEDNKLEQICAKNYNSIYDFINFNFESDLVLKTPQKIGSDFELKNEPGKILPIIINIINE